MIISANLRPVNPSSFGVCVKNLVGLFLDVNNHGGSVRVTPNVFITACEAGAVIDYIGIFAHNCQISVDNIEYSRFIAY